ncbi:N-acetyltransferase [Catellatospora tritici]|uniref:N-acetyltransferase n=1 Tax=Catellatospora tritici TaxID=2851566 RepID=UPI001C2CCBA4|nr:N-acetyltransferase [Catellatospora tritici]MBV1852315.1 N-acetyltransferase [Catellatospora tritici]
MRISVLADRPDLLEPLWGMPSPWPEFMRHDPISSIYYNVAHLIFPEFVLVAEHPDEPGTVVSQAYSIPFQLVGDELPDDGWDGAIRRGIRTHLAGDTPNIVSAIEIGIRKDMQGKGLSSLMLAAMRDNAARLGFTDLVAPVRPNGKTDPDEPMSVYAFRTRPDGLPVDPWLRVHVRAGGVIEKVAPRSMVIPGTLAEWRDRTGLPFDADGPVHVPFALTPVNVDVAHDSAVYVEPNVWVRHRTA